MKTPLLLLAALLFAGCSTSVYKRESRDGSSIKVANSRFIWSTEGFEAEFDADGKAKVKIAKSNPDAVTASAITEAAVSAAIKSTVPTVPKLPAVK